MTTEALTRRVLNLLQDKGWRMASAESCTGGGISWTMTAVPGSSAFFAGGIISYTNEVKQALLGVPAEILEQYGAVSEQTAAAMAEGARRALSVDVAVSATGLAGPDGDGSDNPVGRVYLGCSCPFGTVVWKCTFSGNRENVRLQAVREALRLVMTCLTSSCT